MLMHSRKIFYLILLASVIGFFGHKIVLASAVYLKNGSSLEGEIVSEDKKYVVLGTPYGTITIDRSQIEDIIIKEKEETSNAPEIFLPAAISPTEIQMPVNPTAQAPDEISMIEAKARTGAQKEINKMLFKLAEAEKGEEVWQVFDGFVAASKFETDYLSALLQEVNNPRILKWVILALGKHNVHSSVKYMFNILNGNDESLRIAVVNAFEQMKDISTTQLLRSRMSKETSPAVKAAIINNLASDVDKESLPMILGNLNDADEGVRKAAINATANILEKTGPEDLEEYDVYTKLKDKMLMAKTKEIQQEIFSILGQVKNSQSINILISLLAENNPDIRREAAVALGNIKDKSVTQALLSRLGREPEADIKIGIIQALQKTGDFSAVPVLIEMLLDKNINIKASAARALGTITPFSYGENYQKWKEWWEKKK